LSIYRNGLYDLLWELNAVPDEGAEGSYYWLVRTLAWLEDPKRNPTRRAQLMAFYRRPDARFYHLAGRCLLGLEPDATLLPLACRPHGVAVDRYGVVGAHRVAPRETHRHSDTRARRPLEHQRVAPSQPLEREAQPAELVELVRIRSRQIEHEIGPVAGDEVRQ